jgi:phospholipase/carboxylesterase
VSLIHTLAHPGTDGPLPTVIALHGYGSHAMDLVGLSPMLNEGRLLVICPQAPHRIEAGAFSFSWSSAPRDSERATAAAITAAATEVLAFVESALARYPIDPKRLVLLGFSQGGGVAAHAALAAPERFAGLALLSTSLDDERIGDLHAAPGAADLPVIIQHGASDATVPVTEAFAASIRLQTLGLKPDLQQFPMQHEISHESAHSLSDWLKGVLKLTD